MKEKEFEKEYKKIFNNINLNDDKKSKMLNNIINHKNRYVLKPSMALLILVVSIFLGGTVYAVVKSDFYNTLIVMYKDRDNGEKDVNLSSSAIKEINYQSEIRAFDNTQKQIYYSYEEVETKLGIKLLKSNLFKDQKLYIGTIERDNNNNIGRIEIRHYKNNLKNNDNLIIGWFHYRIATKYAKKIENSKEEQELIEKYNLAWSHNATELYIKNLNTTALIALDSDRVYRCRFDYDNIRYDTIIAIKNHEKLNEKEKIQLVSDFFETLKY